MTKKTFPFLSLLVSISLTALAQNNAVRAIKTKRYDPANNLVRWPDEFNPERTKWFVYNEIEINATPEKVWTILIDAKKWHRFYKGLESPVEYLDSNATTLRTGLPFKIHTMGLRLTPVIKEFIPNERMAWEVRRSNLTAYHAWVIIPTEKGCKLITPESQNGFLTLLQKMFQPNKLLNLHEHWLEQIKARAENTTPQLTEMERDKMIEILKSSMEKFIAAVNNVSYNQLNFRAATKKWTISECIEHVTLAEMEFPRILEKELQRPADPGFRRRINIRDEQIQPKMMSKKWKAKSPEVFKPLGKFASANEAIATFQMYRLQTIAYVENTNDDLRNRYWKHPLTGHIDLYQTLLLMSAHLERHIEQIEEIKATHGFPNNK